MKNQALQLENLAINTEMVARAREGDELAWKALFDRDREMVFRISYRILLDREEALDNVQETFIKAFKKIEMLTDDIAWSAWLRKIAANSAITKARQKNRLIHWLGHKMTIEDAEIGPVTSPKFHIYSNPENFELVEALNGAISSLPPMQRAVAGLFFEEGLTGPEIAGTLDINQNTVRSHLMKARKRLQRRLEKFLPEGDNS